MKEHWICGSEMIRRCISTNNGISSVIPGPHYNKIYVLYKYIGM